MAVADVCRKHNCSEQSSYRWKAKFGAFIIVVPVSGELLDMWDAIALVSSGLTLVAFVAAISGFIYHFALGRKERRIALAPEAERAPLVRDTLEFFHVDTNKVSRQQQYELALAQIHARSARVKTTANVIILVAAAFAVMTALAIMSGGFPAFANSPDRAQAIAGLEINLQRL